MSTTEYFLFPLAFLVSGLLAAWIRQVAKEREAFPAREPAPSRDAELLRLAAALASALERIEDLERRVAAQVREPDVDRPHEVFMIASPTVAAPRRDPWSVDRATPAATAAPAPGSPSRPEADSPAGSEPESEASESEASVSEAPESEAAVSEAAVSEGSVSESEVSESQWRSAMDRLGPSWLSAPRLADRRPGSPPVASADLTEPPVDESPSGPVPRNAPLDDLFPLPATRTDGGDRSRPTP